MLNTKDILSIEFYKKEPFHGSIDGLRYRIEKKEEEDKTMLLCTTWPEPFGFEATDDSLKEYYKTSFDNEGLEAIVDYINNKVKA